MKLPAQNLRAEAGFTIVELAAVLAVTAIIGALGVSAYHTYSVRAEIANGIAGTEAVRDRVTAVFKTTGIPPTDRQTLGLAPGRDEAWGEYVEDVQVMKGRLDVRFGHSADDAISGRTLSITPFETADGRIVWLCGNKLPGPGLQPLGFAGGAPEPAQILTLIDVRFLPPSCR